MAWARSLWAVRHVEAVEKLGVVVQSESAALLPAGAGLAASASAVSAQVSETSMRGSLDASVHGMSPGAMDDQSRAFQRLLDAAAANGEPVFLPPGDYVVSNIILPIKYSARAFLFRLSCADRI